MFGYPLAYFHRQSFWRGELPLWNPFSNCGLPFLAQWNTLTLYPLSLIYLLLPLTWSLSFFCLAHMFWGRPGHVHFWRYRWTGHRWAAALAGVIFSFNGLTLNALMWPNIIAALGWLPWVVWLGQRAWREGGKPLVWAALAGALQMLAAGPEVILLTWLILFVFACGDWVRREGPRSRIPVRFGLVALLVATVCAAQLLPFLELLAHSQRDQRLQRRTHDWSMPFWGWANFPGAAVPNLANRPRRVLSEWPILDLLLLRGHWHRAVRSGGGATRAGLAGARAGRPAVAGPGHGSGRQRPALSRSAVLSPRHRLSPLPGEVCDPGAGCRAIAGGVWVCGPGR